MTQQPYGPPPGQQPAYPAQNQQGQYPPPGQQPQYPQQTPGGYQHNENSSYGPVTQQAPAQGGGFNKPGAPTGGGESVNLHQLDGRLVLFRVNSWDPTSVSTQNPQAKPGLILAEAIVMDGPPIAGAVNGSTNQVTPFESGPKVPPFYVATMYIRGAVMPGQLADFAPGRGMCLGRVVPGTPGKQGKPPWILQDPTEQDEALAYSIVGMDIRAGFDRIRAAAAPAPTQQQFGQPTPAAPVQQAPVQYQQPQPYQAPNPQQYPPAGPPAAPWAQPQQAAPPPWAQQ